MPWIGIADYVRLLQNLSDTFDGQSYTPYALLLDLDVPSEAARLLTWVLGAALLVLTWRRRSLGLAIGAALVLSPIVWRHFFALLLVPLALRHPRLNLAWAIPLGFWLVPGSYNGAPWQTAFGLAVFGATLLACETGRAAVPGLRDKAAGGRIEASPAPRAS